MTSSFAGASADEGRVDDELNRVDDELSYIRPVDTVWSVPLLPLTSGQLFVSWTQGLWIISY